jgi:hypothetical protein
MIRKRHHLVLEAKPFCADSSYVSKPALHFLEPCLSVADFKWGCVSIEAIHERRR